MIQFILCFFFFFYNKYGFSKRSFFFNLKWSKEPMKNLYFNGVVCQIIKFYKYNIYMYLKTSKPFEGCSFFFKYKILFHCRACPCWMHSGAWTGMWKVLPNVGGSWWSRSVQKENVSLRTGRIRAPSRDSSFSEPFGLTGWPTLSSNERASENYQKTTNISLKFYFKISWSNVLVFKYCPSVFYTITEILLRTVWAPSIWMLVEWSLKSVLRSAVLLHRCSSSFLLE